MHYIQTTEATGWVRQDFQGWKARVLRAILFFVPNANPDHEKLYPEVCEWLLELDEKGRPNREIGLNSEGRSLLAAPNDRNFGLWTDSPSILDFQQYDQITSEEFEEKWAEVVRRT